MADPQPRPPAASGNWSDLSRRTVSGGGLAALALLATWLGGWPFAVLWTAAGVAALREWLALTQGGVSEAGFAVGALAIVAAAGAALMGEAGLSCLLLLAGAGLCFPILPARERLAAAAGVIYAGAMTVPVVLLRGDPAWGALAVVFVFAVVWGSDILAYFTGRFVGGPKLWPRVSPKKTWSGFVGGMIAGGIGGLLVALCGTHAAPAILAALGAGLAVVSQGGDLFESALKRRFGVKDTGTLIPGHGGVMDRLDGFVAAATAACLIGALHAGAEPGRGLLLW